MTKISQLRLKFNEQSVIRSSAVLRERQSRADSVLHLRIFPGVQFPLLVGWLCLSSNAAFKSAGNLTNEQRCERRGCCYCSTHPCPSHIPPPFCSGAPLSTDTFLYFKPVRTASKPGAKKLLQEEPRRPCVPKLFSSFYRHIHARFCKS